MADPAMFDHFANEDAGEMLLPHKPTRYDQEMRQAYAKYNFMQHTHELDEPSEPILIGHDSFILPEEYKAIDAYFEHRNNGHPAGDYSNDALMQTVMAHMATNLFVKRCSRYIRGLDELHFAALRMYLMGLPINRVIAMPADKRAGDEHVKFSKVDETRFVFNEDGTVDIAFYNYNDVRQYMRFSGFAAEQAASRGELIKAAMLVLARLLQEVMDGAPLLDKEVVVWRMGVFPKMLPGEPVHELGRQMCSALASNAFISTSLLSEVTGRFAQGSWVLGRPGYLGRMIVPKGVRCLYLGYAVPDNDYEEDAEILFAPNTCFTPTDDWHEAPTFLCTNMLNEFGHGVESPYLTTDVMMRNYVADTTTRPHVATGAEYHDVQNVGVQIVPYTGEVMNWGSDDDNDEENDE